MNVKDFIKVTVVASKAVSVVPARNKAIYEQANDVETKAKKPAIYKITEASEAEVIQYYPEFAQRSKPVGNVITIAEAAKQVEEATKKVEAEAAKQVEDKDAEIAVLKEQLAKVTESKE